MSSSPGYDESEPKQTWCQHSQGYGQVYFSHRVALRSLDKVLHLSQPWAEYTMTLLQPPSNNFIAILVCVNTLCAIHTVTKLPGSTLFEHISTVKQCKPAYLSVTYLPVICLSTHLHVYVCATYTCQHMYMCCEMMIKHALDCPEQCLSCIRPCMERVNSWDLGKGYEGLARHISRKSGHLISLAPVLEEAKFV